MDPNVGNLLECRHLIKGTDKEMWYRDLANDVGRLVQGAGARMMTWTNTVFFTHPGENPKHKKRSYCELVATIRPTKTKVNRVRATIGGDRLECQGWKSTMHLL